jgi:hypothetical protein
MSDFMDFMKWRLETQQRQTTNELLRDIKTEGARREKDQKESRKQVAAASRPCGRCPYCGGVIHGGYRGGSKLHAINTSCPSCKKPLVLSIFQYSTPMNSMGATQVIISRPGEEEKDIAEWQGGMQKQIAEYNAKVLEATNRKSQEQLTRLGLFVVLGLLGWWLLF